MYECNRSLLIVGEPFVFGAEHTLNVRSTRASFVDSRFTWLSVYVETYVLLPASRDRLRRMFGSEHRSNALRVRVHAFSCSTRIVESRNIEENSVERLSSKFFDPRSSSIRHSQNH